MIEATVPADVRDWAISTSSFRHLPGALHADRSIPDGNVSVKEVGVYVGQRKTMVARSRRCIDDIDEIDEISDNDFVEVESHIIVSGDDALAKTIVKELTNAGASVVKLAAAELADAWIARALAVVCAGDDDGTNLEIALLARRANPDVRVVVRLDNDVVRAAMAANNGPGAILDVADLAAPSVVEACLASTTHTFEAAGINFVVWSAAAPHDATLRDLQRHLEPPNVSRRTSAATRIDWPALVTGRSESYPVMCSRYRALLRTIIEQHFCCSDMEPMTGIEPAYSAWEVDSEYPWLLQTVCRVG